MGNLQSEGRQLDDNSDEADDYAIFRPMTKLLEEVIEQIREMPEAEQDLAAQVLLNIVAKKWEPERLDPATRSAILEGLAQVERGELVSDEEMAEFFRQRGV